MGRISEFIITCLVNATWQLAAVAIGASICARLLRNAAPRYRHALWVASLLLSLALPIWSFFGFQIVTPVRTADAPAVALATRDVTSSQEPTSAPQVTGVPGASGFRLDDLLQTRRQSLSTSSSLTIALAFAYGLFLLYRLIVLLHKWLQAQALRRSAYERQPSAILAAVTARCQQAFGLKRVRIMFSIDAIAPATVGAWTPVIILPEKFYDEVSEETLATMLGHEMAHVARRDFALNLAYEFLFLPISFHPVAGLFKRKIDGTREIACDDLVTERLMDPNAYARSLVRVASGLMSPRGHALTLGVFDADILEERIMKLTLHTKRVGARHARLLALCSFSLLCVLCIAISTFSFDLRTSQSNVSVFRETKSEATSGDRSSPQSNASAQNQSVTRVTSSELTQRSGLAGVVSFHDGPYPEAASATARLSARSDDAQARAESACLAGRNHEVEAIPKLVAMLGDDTPTQLIKCWEEGRWSPALDSFKQPSPGEQAAIALASMGTAALEPLNNALADSNPSVRRNAAWAIGELTNMKRGERANAVPPLIALLDDSDEWVRMAAARALGEIRDGRAAEGLITQLSDRHWRVRRLAAWALGEMKVTRSIESLSRLLQSDSEPDVRVTSAWALGEIKGKSAIDVLCAALVSDEQPEVRRTTAWALGELQSPKSVSFLQQALSDPDERVRAKAAWALSEILNTEK